MNSHYSILISIIIIVGGIAGFTNYLTYYFKGYIEHRLVAIKHILSSIGAAILVPLFLNMLSSSLIVPDDDFKTINYFVFAGFCFIAGHFSDRFINSIGEKVLKEVEQVKIKAEEAVTAAKESEKRVNFIVESETEIDDEDAMAINVENSENKEDDLSKVKNLKSVLETFSDARYRYRTTKGIAKQTKMPEDEVIDILNQLEKNKAVIKVINKSGQDRWGASSLGRHMIKQL